eukprot:tig00021621_g22963.t1
MRAPRARTLAEAEELIRREAAAGGDIAAEDGDFGRAPRQVARLRAALDAALGGALRPRRPSSSSARASSWTPLLGPEVCSLRVPVSERALHATLMEHARAPLGPRRGRRGIAADAAMSEAHRAAAIEETGPGEAEGPGPAPAEAPAPAPPAAPAGPRIFRLEFERSRSVPLPYGSRRSARRRVPGAEDTPTNAKILLMQLAKLRVAREAAAGPAPFDVLLSDIMMPVMDGLESLRRMRAELPARRVPYAIALSANVGARDRRQCAEAGYDAFLPKPVRVEDLARALAQAGAAGAAPAGGSGAPAAGPGGREPPPTLRPAAAGEREK